MRARRYRPTLEVLEDRTALSTYKVSNISYGPSSQQQLDVMSNTTYTNAPVVFLLHGGQFTSGSKTTMESEYANYFLSQGFVVVGVNYRLVSSNGHGGFNNQFPTAVVDTASAITWFEAHASTYGANPNEIVLQGTSAGADIATMIAYDPTGITGFTNWGQPSPIHVAGVMADSGEYNWALVPSAEQSIVQNYLGAYYGSPQWNPTEPITYVGPGLPPSLIIDGTNDTMAPYQNSVNLVNALQAAGDKVTFASMQGYTHGEFSQNFARSASEQATVTSWLQSIGL
jgi:acetyl esterase/lipase